MKNIYLLGSESAKAAVLAQGISRISTELQVIGVTKSRFSSRIYSKHLNDVLRFEKDVSLLPFLMALKPGIDVVIPVTSEWARFLCTVSRELIPEKILFQGDSFEELDNKEFFCSTLMELSIRTPMIFKALEDLPNKKLVAKPVIGASSKGVIYFEPSRNTSTELHNLRNLSGYIIQDFIDGFGAGVSGFCISGESYSIYCHKRLMEWPIKGGSSTYRESFQSEELETAFATVARHFNWTGFLMLEAKIDRDGNPWIIEANPRIWGSLRQSTENTDILREFVLQRHLNSKCGSRRTFQSPLAYVSAMVGIFCRPIDSIKFAKDARKMADVSFFRDPKGWMSQFGR